MGMHRVSLSGPSIRDFLLMLSSLILFSISLCVLILEHVNSELPPKFKDV